jgi:hypothetical protein
MKTLVFAILTILTIVATSPTVSAQACRKGYTSFYRCESGACITYCVANALVPSYVAAGYWIGKCRKADQANCAIISTTKTKSITEPGTLLDVYPIKGNTPSFYLASTKSYSYNSGAVTAYSFVRVPTSTVVITQ